MIASRSLLFKTTTTARASAANSSSRLLSTSVRPISLFLSQPQWLVRPTNNEQQQPQTSSLSKTTIMTVRWKHAARKGNHLEVLDDMAHSQEREQAKEKRQKKKDRKLKKKKGKSGGATEKGGGGEDSDLASPAAAAGQTSVFAMEGKNNDNDDDDFDFDDDDDDDEGDDDEVELPDAKKIQDRMMDMVGKYEEALKSIRGAEPTPELFDDIMVNAYGSDTSLKAVAQVVIASPTMASITCFDPSLVKEVRASIQLQLGLNPQADASEGDAGVLKVPLPKVSLESRQKTAQQLSKKAEAFRQKIRRVRRRYNGIIKQGKEGKLEHISKDDVFRVSTDIDDATDKAIKKINEVTDTKHNSIMDVQ